MTTQLHLIFLALKQKPAARSERAPRVSSIAGWFSRLPWLGSAADSVAPDACPLVRAAAQASPAVLREDAQSDNTRATTPDEPATVEPVETWPRCGVPAQLSHGGRSDSPA